MYLMRAEDKADYERYRKLGTPEELERRLAGIYPDDEGRAPLPMADRE